MTRLNCALRLLLAFTILDGYPGVAQSSRTTTWLTCSLTEGKGDSCSRGDEARPFEEFLTPGGWGNTPGDSFSGDFQFDLKQPETKWRVTWSEVGKLSSHRIRQVRYLTGESSFAALILAEIRTGVFAPLMKWSGQMPEPTILTVNRTDIMEMGRDWGGNIPMVQSWTWIWRQGGPRLLDIAPAIREATQKVAPGYSGYGTGFDWHELHYQTWVWKDTWPGKIGVSDQIDAWFTFRDGRLTVKRVELRENFSETPTRRWPK